MRKTTLKQVKAAIRKIKNVKIEDFRNEVIESFGNYTFQKESEVIVNSDAYAYELPESYTAYINKYDAPIVKIYVEFSEDEKEISAVSVY